MDFQCSFSDNGEVSGPSIHTRPRWHPNFMSTKTTAAPAVPAVAAETEAQRFDRVLNRPEFGPLKAVISRLLVDSALMNAALITTNSYQMFLAKLGFRVEVVKQIHENDCYSRLGPAGGIRAVIPLHDTATYSTMVTLVNYDASVTTTNKAVDFYDKQLADFKAQLMNKGGNR